MAQAKSVEQKFEVTLENGEVAQAYIVQPGGEIDLSNYVITSMEVIGADGKGGSGKGGGKGNLLLSVDGGQDIVLWNWVELSEGDNPPVVILPENTVPENDMVAELNTLGDIEPAAGGPAPASAPVAGPDGGGFTVPGLENSVFTPPDVISGVLGANLTDFGFGTLVPELLPTTPPTIVPLPPVNLAPDAVDDAFVTNEDTVISGQVLTNDTDPEGDPLTVISNTAPAHGSVVVNADGTFTYTPDTNYNGVDTFTYTISDGTSTDTATVTITVNPVNDVPDAVDDTNTTAFNTAVSGQVLTNDTDPDGDVLTVVANTNPANGTVIVNADGTYTYTPTAGFTGVDTFTYTISDGNGGSDTATVTITVGVNSAPDAVNDSFTTNEDVAVSGQVLTNDTDPDGDTLTVIANTNPSHGSVVMNADGTFTYTPVGNYNGTDSFTYTISDGNGGTDTATVNITVNPVNDAPDAVNDSFTTNEDTAVSGQVLTNDTDPDGDTLTVIANTNPSHGSVVMNADGTFTYTPVGNYNGTDSFTYTISDGNGGTDTATVNITVNPVNDVPDAVNDSFTTNEDVAVSGQVLTNDTDPDGDTLTVVGHTNPSHGSVVIAANGLFTYTPTAGFNGVDTFTYTISDGHGGSDTATVTINIGAVNDAPDAVNDNFTTNEDVAVSGQVLTNDTDPDGDTLTVIANTNPAHGTVVMNANGTFTYTPAGNFNGSDSFDYTISDGNGGTDTATVFITVNPVNDAPDAVNDAFTTNEDVAVSGQVLTNDTDLDGDTLTVIGNTNPSHGSVVMNANGTFTYTPTTNFHGNDSFTYTISDGHGGTDTATVNITVNSVNDAPDAVNDSFTTNEDTAVSGQVLTNDTDPDGDTLTVVGHTNPSHGSVVIAANGLFTYTPTGNFNGSDSFTYTISDGHGGTDTATVFITVNPVNDAPDAVNDSFTTNEDVAVSGQVLTNDTDPDGDTLTVVGHTNPSHGSVVIAANGLFTYTPTANFHGTDSFTYTISDGHGGSDTATVNITVNSVNDVPDAVNDNFTTNEDVAVSGQVLTNDTDPDGDTLTVIGNTNPAHGTVVMHADGTFTYTPTGNFNGSDSFDYTISDGHGGTDTATVFITVNPVNDAPDAVNDTNVTAFNTAVSGQVLTNDTDPDGDTLTVVGHTNPSHGSVVINANGTYTYTPTTNFNGNDSFTYTISDGHGGTDTATVNITVAPPVAQAADYNVTFVVDTSASMANLAPGTGMSGIQFAKQALTNLINDYVSFGSSSTFTFVTFGTTSNTVTFTNAAQAQAFVNGLTTTSQTTSFDVAIAAAQAHLSTTTPTSDTLLNEAYFISDGGANSTLTLAEQNSWQDMISHHFIEVHAIAIGTGFSFELQELDNTGGTQIVTSPSQVGTTVDMVTPGTPLGSVADSTITGTTGADTIYGDVIGDPNYIFGGNDHISGGGGNDIIYGQGGNDLINGGNGADIIFGGAGNDTIYYSGADTIDGGSGYDFLQVASGSATNINLNNVSSIEAIRMEDGVGNDSVTLSLNDVLTTSEQEAFRISGDAGDSVTTTSGNWVFAGYQTAGTGETFGLFVDGPSNAALFVERNLVFNGATV